MAYQQIRLGILGGGQLGKMLIQAAADWNIVVKVLDPDAEAPCRSLAAEFVQGPLTDYATVLAFGQDVDVLTIEIENVNAEALAALAAAGKRVFPRPSHIALIQDKRAQKQFYQTHGIATAPFVLTQQRADLAQHLHRLPAVHKLGRAGYDGRGVQKIATPADVAKGFDEPGVLEQLVDFEKELAVIAARSPSGEVQTFPVVEMVFHPEHNLVQYLFAPAEITAAQARLASETARQVVEALDFVGLLAVEMFLTKTGEVLVNEVAPRPHNSGHHTIEANVTSQYQQLLRAILDLPLGSPEALAPAAMLNLLGEPGHHGPAVYAGLEQVLAQAGVYVHLYGKAVTKPYRKMGHVTVVDHNLARLKGKVDFVEQHLKVISG
ncbi:MAG: 5-(carboxyamino)imidazole ribonucleotide synthase [Bernardetiaceae bacterium]|jgi:5-(carboxyamino)imidazole ribonucleotide synthase|nr:5-(carboxyamino)imidazole ribonucleotide synthase [Bernardetiaceae bacterium]